MDAENTIEGQNNGNFQASKHKKRGSVCFPFLIPPLGKNVWMVLLDHQLLGDAGTVHHECGSVGTGTKR